MARRLSLIIFLGVALCAASRLVGAQQPPARSDAPPPTVSDAPPPSYDTPPVITLVDGTARLTRQGQAQAPVANMPLIEGDRLTTESGRVAVTFPDGSLLHLDRNTSVDFLSLSLMRVLDGRVIFVAAGRGGERPAVDYQIDAPAGSVRVQTAGEYRVSTSSGEVELDVVTGTAALATDQGSVQVEAGQRSFAREGAAPGYPQAFNSARFDAFDQWSEAQRDTEVGTSSAQYLPSDLYAYSGTFDRYGRWEDIEPYGNVWYPTVSVGWRPYYNGYWDYVGPYGWTWIGVDRWAWPTHHFGRWGFRAGLWFWIPGRHWGPAWVSWAYSPGYLSWCPLDYYNRPVMNIFAGNFYGYRSGFYDPWLCWTVMPRHRFGVGVRVANYAVAGVRLPVNARNGFVARRAGPEAPFAVPRRTVGDRADAAGRAMPRALPSVPMQARPRDNAFASPRAMPRGVSPGAQAYTAPRRDSRSLPYPTTPAPSQRYDRPSAVPRSGESVSRTSAGAATPRTVPRGVTPYENRPPSSVQPPASGGASRSFRPGASDRPSAPAAPRSYSVPRYSAPPSRGGAYAAPRDSAPPTRSEAYSAPRYSAPPTRGQTYSVPRSSAPSAYSAPRYSAPPTRGQTYSVPRSSAPSAYSAPRYSPPPSRGPAYSAPRAMSPGYAAPRSGGFSAPRPAPSAPSSRPAPSGSARGGGGRGRSR